MFIRKAALLTNQVLMIVNRKFLYIVHLITNNVINLDHGIIPACSSQLRAELMIDDVSLGLLGSIVFLGIVLGSIARFLNKRDRLHEVQLQDHDTHNHSFPDF